MGLEVPRAPAHSPPGWWPGCCTRFCREMGTVWVPTAGSHRASPESGEGFAGRSPGRGPSGHSPSGPAVPPGLGVHPPLLSSSWASATCCCSAWICRGRGACRATPVPTAPPRTSLHRPLTSVPRGGRGPQCTTCSWPPSWTRALSAPPAPPHPAPPWPWCRFPGAPSGQSCRVQPTFAWKLRMGLSKVVGVTGWLQRTARARLQDEA